MKKIYSKNQFKGHSFFRVSSYISAVVIIAVVIILSLQINRYAGFEKVVVSRHVDGDTVYITDAGGAEQKVRFIGVDCPELRHPTRGEEPYGEAASAFTENMLLGRTVYLEQDVSEVDRYGRLLRYVWLKIPGERTEEEIRSKMFNAILLLEGYAQVATFPPDVEYVDYFLTFQNEAAAAGKGLWSLLPAGSGAVAPSLYIFVASKNSDKYHQLQCTWAKRIATGNLISFMSAEDAAQKGYVPCKVCLPE